MVDVGPVKMAPEELRVLGCLIEKQHTTPDQYPLTMNALVVACNQTSNRSPVTAYDHGTVEAALGLLRQRGVARAVLAPGNRATKYRHVLDEAWGLTQGECAVIAVLALRGAQTLNELHARTERYSGLEDLGGVEAVLDRLAGRYEQPYVRRIGRQPGQREERWTHLWATSRSSPPWAQRSRRPISPRPRPRPGRASRPQGRPGAVRASEWPPWNRRWPT